MIGIAFIPVGIGLLYFSDEVKEHVIDYTKCNETIGTDSSWSYTNETCANVILKNNSSNDCICRINFTLEKDFEVSVLHFIAIIAIKHYTPFLWV